ncbi:BrnT family toxin [Ciceribacter selenitireducens]
MKQTISGFDWDEGNWPKCAKHGLTKREIEQVFENRPSVYPDPSSNEVRSRAIGRTDEGRYVFVVFTLRRITTETYIRPISARFMHDREIRRYEQG